LDLSSHTDNENIIENKNHTSTHQKRYLNSKNSKPPSPPLFNMSGDGKKKLINIQKKTYKPKPKKKLFEDLWPQNDNQSKPDGFQLQ